MDRHTQSVQLNVEMTPVINYAMQQNGLPIIREITLINHSEQPLSGELMLTIKTEPELIQSFTQSIDVNSSSEVFVIRELPLVLNSTFLAGLTERISGNISVELEEHGQVLATWQGEIVALAFDEWHGPTIFPELLTAFVTPNHPEIGKINIKAADLLEQWTGNPSLDAYQTRDPNRVRLQAAAVYGALQAQNLVYSVAPASFEAVGQRVRLCDAVMGQKMGTCLDLTLLYAACLEAIGLRPLLILQQGHIFAAVWLEELTFSESVQDDPSLVTKRLADGINEIEVVECTALTAGRNISFEMASIVARNEINEKSLEGIIDVTRARLSGIRPLPIRFIGQNGWEVVREQLTDTQITHSPTAMEEAVQVTNEILAPTGKLDQWERKLLDLGLRNTLISLRLTKTVIPLLSPSLCDLEDGLASSSEYGICAHPAEWWVPEESRKEIEKVTDLGTCTELIRSEFQNNRLRSALSEKALAHAIVGLYRAAKTAMEENGANTLYLALGLLRWYETASSQKPRYAPIVLLPVEIIRKSALKGYVIRLRDEEPQMNITLLEMLRQDFGISISGLNPLPQDEHGIDIRCVLAVMRKAVMGQRGWDVIESSVLGLFSFSQFVMWNDLRNRSEDLQKNKVVRSLVDGRLSWPAIPMEIGTQVSENSALLAIPADASQLYAIEAAAKGESFVLHGPPGTGKSQTITALISNALAQGKTVLFVAEKMAALSVVQRRLEGIGIGAFCLELHSNKSKKRDVLNQLQAAAEITRLQSAEIYETKLHEIAEARKELDTYTQALHKKRLCGLSLFEMVDRYEPHREILDSVRFPFTFAATADNALLSSQRVLVRQLVVAARAVGHPHKHPLYPVSLDVYSQKLRSLLPEKLECYQAALKRLSTAGEALASALCLDKLNHAEQWTQLRQISHSLADWIPMPRSWAGLEAPRAAMEEIGKMAEHFLSAQQLASTLQTSWQSTFLDQDGNALLAKWKQASAKWFLPRLMGQNQMVKAMVPFCKTAVEKNALEQTFETLIHYQAELAEADRLFSIYGDTLDTLYAKTDTNWEQVRNQASKAIQITAELDALTGSETLRQTFAARKELAPLIAELNEADFAETQAQVELFELLPIDESTLTQDEWLPNRQLMCKKISEHRGELREWTLWRHTCREAIACGLEPLVSAYAEGLDHDLVEVTYLRALYTALIEDTVDQDPELQVFSGALFNEKISRFRQLDQELIELSKTEIYYRLASRVPNFAIEAAQSSEVGILQRAIRSGGRGISIRRLFEQIPNLLLRLCPCMLMSPISAAQYLDPKRATFDIVVFDEASQLPTCKAVGALARAENAIIVGDPKQMPPTSFFSGNSVDEDNLEQEDLESILEDCLALNMPQTHLLWHYRSRHESLIAFSNSRFYKNKLYTFPSVNDLESKVSLIPVDGFFDRGKTRQNRAEAEMIVEELRRRCHDPEQADHSVGVITFSLTQQNLIDDLLTEACKTDPDLEAWSYNREEALFIKNLENVQGDERDVILFSIGYGPDANGKVTMNFGPLNQQGGWRRLNVAVSRARHEMLVFSTITADQIDLARTSSEGVAALKAFLQYAEGTLLAEDAASAQTYPMHTGIANTICSMLKASGYVTQTMIGHSGYRIDIGVVDSANPNRYLLGVLLDGPVYSQSKTTRDREVAPIAVLNGLGWQIHRIWTADWWDNSKKEYELLLNHLRQIESQPQMQSKPQARPAQLLKPIQPAVQIAKGYQTQEQAPERKVCTYQVANLPQVSLSSDDFLLPGATKKIKDNLKTVLDKEAPIGEGLLTRRILQSFSITRAGSRMQSRITTLLNQMRIPFTLQDGQRIYWTEHQDPASYSEFRTQGRDAKDVPVLEAANAICCILQEQIGLPREDLIRETSKLLGYARTGNVVIALVSAGIENALASGRIFEEQDGYLRMCK